jgi:DNA-binding CsgD family transcriptional regulator
MIPVAAEIGIFAAGLASLFGAGVGIVSTFRSRTGSKSDPSQLKSSAQPAPREYEPQNSGAANQGDENPGVVTKTVLIEEIAGKTNTSKTDAQRLFDAFTETVTDSLKTGERVQITGKYYVQKRDAQQGIHIARIEGKVDEQLSEREIEVLKLLASGRTSPEIARNLHISTSTLRRRLRNIYGKLGAENYAEALDKARTEGLLR